MPANVDLCPQGHEIRSAADRDGQGYCKRCRAENARQRRVSNAMRLALVQAFEEAGARFETDDGQPVAPVEVVRQLAEIYERAL